MDRPRGGYRGGRGGPRRPAHQPRAGPRAAPQRAPHGDDPRRARRGAAGRGPRDPAQRRRCSTPCWPAPRSSASPLVAGGGLSTAGAGHAVPGDDDVRRPGRHARPAPARPPGGLRRGAAPARHDGRARRADGRAAAARRAARRGVPRAALPLRAGHLRPAGDRPARAGRAHLRPGRTHRLRQVHAGVAALAGGRARAGARCCWAASTSVELDLQALRAAVGVVTQRTEILAGTLAENITLFGAHPRATVEAAVAELGLTDWVAGLPAGLDTELGPGGTSFSAGEEQLVAFARLLVRDVRVVVLDEATARMDPVTEARVVRAADRLISGRTGLLVAHRLSTTQRAEQVAVLEAGRVVQHGRRERLAAEDGAFRRLLTASASEADVGRARPSATTAAEHRLDPALDDAATAAGGAAIAQPHPRDLARPDRRAAVGSGRHGALPAVRADRRVRRGHRLALGPGRHRPRRTECVRSASPSRWSPRLLVEPAAALAGVPRLPALVDLGAAAGARRRPRRTDHASTGWSGPRRVRWSRARWTPTGCRGTPTAGSTSSTASSSSWSPRCSPATGWPGLVLLAVMVSSALASSFGRRVAGRSAAAVLHGAGRVRPLAGLRPRVGADRQARGGDPRGARAPAAGRRRPGRRGGARAPGAGAARRRARRDGPVRGGRRLGRPAGRRVGAGDRHARGQRRQRLRLVRSRRRLGGHRGARRARVDAGDQPRSPVAAT